MLYYVALLPLRDNSIIISILNFLVFFFFFFLFFFKTTSR